jgi:glutathione S-transferase
MGLKITGATLSPFVRKVLVFCLEKGIAYELDPMMPMGVSDEYKAKHPLGKVPLLEDGDRVIPDSSAICAYLEKLHPKPALYPSDPYEYARALWYEEFADTGIVQTAAVPFVENILARAVFQREPDPGKLEEALTVQLPPHLDYLEKALDGNDYLVGNRFSIADISMGCHFGNFVYGGGSIDPSRWPGVAAYIGRLHGRRSLKGLMDGDRATLAQMKGA